MTHHNHSSVARINRIGNILIASALVVLTGIFVFSFSHVNNTVGAIQGSYTAPASATD